MAFSVLICDPDTTWGAKNEEYLSSCSYKVQKATNGKDAQLMAYNYRFYGAILDLNTKNNHALEVLKYFRMNRPNMKVIVTAETEDILKNWGLTEEDLIRLGATTVLHKPFELEKIKDILDGTSAFSQWKQSDFKKEGSSSKADEEIDANDSIFTSIKLEEFFTGNVSFFDYYVKIGTNKYIKILNRGDKFDQERLDYYKAKGQLDVLYFKTEDRKFYINYMNEILGKIVESDSVDYSVKASMTKNVLEKYVEEIYISGVTPELFEEGQKACQRVNTLLSRDKNLKGLVDQMVDFDPSSMGHSYLVTFFSAAISKNLEWGSDNVVEKVSLGSILHDIGKTKMDPLIMGKKVEDMTEEELHQYKHHPQYGFQLLSSISYVPEIVRQIVYQHHEKMTGDGFPLKLSGSKIYPLAKIVGFSNFFAHFLSERKLKPMEGLREFIPDRDLTIQYDAEIIKAFISVFIPALKKKAKKK